MRFLALLVLVAQLGALAGPALAAPPAGHTHHVCGAVPSPTASVEAQSGSDCASCDTAECGGMLTCSAVSPALVAESAVTLECPLVPQRRAALVDQEIDFYLTLTSPPPKP